MFMGRPKFRRPLNHVSHDGYNIEGAAWSRCGGRLYGTSVNRTERRVEAGKHHGATRSCTGLTPQPNSHTRKSIHAAHYIRKPLLTDARRRHGRFADMWRCLDPVSFSSR